MALSVSYLPPQIFLSELIPINELSHLTTSEYLHILYIFMVVLKKMGCLKPPSCMLLLRQLLRLQGQRPGTKTTSSFLYLSGISADIFYQYLQDQLFLNLTKYCATTLSKRTAPQASVTSPLYLFQPRHILVAQTSISQHRHPRPRNVRFFALLFCFRIDTILINKSFCQRSMIITTIILEQIIKVYWQL